MQVVLQRRPAIEALAAAMLRDNLDEPIPGSVIVDIIERSPLDQVEEVTLPAMLVSTWVLGTSWDFSVSEDTSLLMGLAVTATCNCIRVSQRLLASTPCCQPTRAALTVLQACWCTLTVLRGVTHTVLELLQ